MNKTAIKNFAVWARRKLISEITYKAGLIGINDKGILKPLPMSTNNIHFFDIGTGKPTEISDNEIKQHDALISRIKEKETTSDYETAFQFVVEEVAYTWFNRLIAIRFMEVNDYLPSRIRVLSSSITGKTEPDMVTTPFETDIVFSVYETDRIMQLKHENKLDELFRMLFIKQCNKLNEVLPELFEKTADYTELLLTISFTDSDGIVSHLINDIAEDDFTEAVEIIGWMYQYYNTEPKDEVFALLKKNVKITKERLPAATQLFTPDWIVRYMVENSLGKLWVEGHPNESLKSEWKYFLEEAEQEDNVKEEIEKIRTEYKKLNPEGIKIIDPCMGSGHILVYAFDVLMQIYESQGYAQRDAAVAIVENNLYGLDIDDRAFQLAYFAVMMKARKYDRRFLTRTISPKLYTIKESNEIRNSDLQYFGFSLSDVERILATQQIEYLLRIMIDAKEFGSILKVDNCDWGILHKFADDLYFESQISMESIDASKSQKKIKDVLLVCEVLAQKYDVVITNPPYLGNKGMNTKLAFYLQKEYPCTKYDLFACFIEKCILMCNQKKYVSLITQNSWMALSRYEDARSIYLKNSIITMAHLGTRAFDDIAGEVVQTVAFCIGKDMPLNYTGSYIKLVEFAGETLKEEQFFNPENKYLAKVETFLQLPNKIVSYWANDTIINCFSNNENIEAGVFYRQGMATSDNDRFLRYWTEVNFNRIGFNLSSIDDARDSKLKWFPYNKGGSYRKWYGNNELIVNWENDGYEMKTYTATLPQGTDVRLKSKEYYFRKGFTWSALATEISVRYCPQGFIFDTKGSMGFPYKEELTKYFVGLLNSKVSQLFLSILAPTLDFNLVSMKQIPMKIENDEILTDVVDECIELSKADWDSFETSWDFIKHPILEGKNIQLAYEKWEESCENRFNQLKSYELELNRNFIDVYGLQYELVAEIKDKDIAIRKADIQRDVKSFISYSVGCMFGRYSLDIDGLAYAGGEWDKSRYTTYIPDRDNCIPITDEEYFSGDIVGRLVDFVKCVFGAESLDENLEFIAKALGNKGDTSREIIRSYFVKDFYKDHVRTYQKRPIYWLYDSGKQDGFKALVYMHRYTADTTGIVRVDYLHKIQKIYTSEIDRMNEIVENSIVAREIAQAEKRKEKLIKQLKETIEYDEKIAHIALSRIVIDLDDGVKFNYEKIQIGQDGKKLDILGKI